MAPTTEMAEMALVSDISGVCSSGETLRITSRPTKVASMKTNSPSSRFMDASCSDRLRRGSAHQFPHLGVNHFAAARHQRFAHDLVLAVERQLAVLDQVLQERGDVACAYIWLAW